MDGKLNAIKNIIESLDSLAVDDVFGKKTCPECGESMDECECEKDEEIKKKMPKIEILSVAMGKKKPSKKVENEEPY